MTVLVNFDEHSAIQDLVNGINAKFTTNNSPRHYAFVAYTRQNNGKIGTDAITTGLLYDTKTVKPVGNSSIITLPTQEFENGEKEAVIKAQRPSFVQTFEALFGNDSFTVVVNHLKSKGSACWEDEPENLVEDGQQHCNIVTL